MGVRLGGSFVQYAREVFPVIWAPILQGQHDGTYINANLTQQKQDLTNLESHGQEDAVSVRRQPILPPRNARRQPLLLLNTRHNLMKLHAHLDAVAASHPDERLQRLLVPVVLRQPPRALLGQEHAQAQDAAGHQLQGHGDAPLRRRRFHVLRGAVVDPVADGDAQGEEELEEAAELAADFLGGHFGRVHGDDDGCDACFGGRIGIQSVIL